MKKLLGALMLIFALTLTACSQEEDPPEHTNNVFQQIREKLRLDIEVEEATYACTFVRAGEEAGMTCFYAVKLLVPEFSDLLTDYVYVEATLIEPENGDPFFFADTNITRTNYQHLVNVLTSDSYQRQVLDQLAENPFAQDYSFEARKLSTNQIKIAMEGVN